MVGHTLSHYKILEELGRGGMGIVYKAEDTKLDRTVAIKVLPSNALTSENARHRLHREARAAGRLSHPNIATIFEINSDGDQLFIAMEYVKGVTLREQLDVGRSSVSDSCSFAIQIAQALQYAHDAGIVHRDIKPSNIIVTSRDQIKILDFGLAKIVHSSLLTVEGTTLGTIGYVSPEQVRGEDIDHRSDIWSLGVVLYEMLSGRRPFDSDYDQAIIYSILNEDPQPVSRLRPEVPDALDQTINKALQKDPDSRWPNMDTLVRSLESLDTRAWTKKHDSKAVSSSSVAVLPFEDMSPDRDQEYLCDGMAEEIMNELSRVENLRVVARTSAFAFKGEHIDVREVGQQLNVEAVLEGSVRKAGNRLRISTQLVDSKNGFHLWTERFDRNMDDVFTVQDEIARAVVDTLAVKLGGAREEPLIDRAPDDLETYTQYLKALHFLNKRTSESVQKAIDNFQEVLRVQPNHALSYAALADAYLMFGLGYGAKPPKDAWKKAKAAAERAIEINPRLPEAHVALGRVKLHFDWDWQGAETSLLQALNVNPNCGPAHQFYGWYLIAMGRFEESYASFLRAQKLDPLSVVINTELGWPLHYASRIEEAITQYKKVLELDDHFALAHFDLGIAYLHQEKYEEAISELQLASSQSGGNAFIKGGLGYAYAIYGEVGLAKEILEDLLELSSQGFVVSMNIADVYAGLGDKEKAFQWLETAYEERHPLMLVVDYWSSKFTGSGLLNDDPRMDQLLQKLGLSLARDN